MDNYSRRDFLKVAGLGAAALAVPGCLSSAKLCALDNARKRPNFVFFLVDDMGWMDSSTYGSKYYETPNMDRLAKQSMLFTDAYAAAPSCSPTRASIIAGKYPGRLKITVPSGGSKTKLEEPTIQQKAWPGLKVLSGGSRTQLPLDEFTFAEALSEAGYATGFIGKWHLGHEKWWPDKQGFDINIAGAHYPGPPSYFSPYGILNLKDGPKNQYITDRLTDESLKFMQDNRDRPFMLCLWHYAVHAPWEAKQEDIEKFRGKTDPRGEQHNPEMAALLYSMDQSLGRVLDKLNELKLTDNTVVILFSDNGGLTKVPGGPEVVRCGGRYHGGDQITSNKPLRGGKGNIYEGGTREPLLVRWPGIVKPNSRSAEVISSVDFYPTILEIAGIKPKPGQILDGESIVPVLKQTGGLKRQTIFCHIPSYAGRGTYPPCTSVRKGDWKLIRFYGEGATPAKNGYELYNLKEDIGEANNLAEKMPKKVKQLDALIDKFLSETGSLVPIPNPRYKKNGKLPPKWRKK